MKCFQVTTDWADDEDTRLYFAKSHIEAKRRYVNEFGYGNEIAGVSAVRKPEWDDFAPGPIPPLELIDAGWWFECLQCNELVNSDLEGEDGRDLEPVEHGCDSVFCSPACASRFEWEMAFRKRWHRRLMIGMSQKLAAMFPDAAPFPDDGSLRNHTYIAHEHGGWRVRQVILSFAFPGQKIGPATLRLDRQHPRATDDNRSLKIYCCNGDRQVFEAWSESQRKTREAA